VLYIIDGYILYRCLVVSLSGLALFLEFGEKASTLYKSGEEAEQSIQDMSKPNTCKLTRTLHLIYAFQKLFN